MFLERLFQILGLDQQYTGLRSSAIDQGYLLRAIAMEATLERTLIQWSIAQTPFQVLNLGAGFDLTYFRLTNAGLLNPLDCHYFEVDLPSVIRDKSLVIRSHPIFHAMWQKPGQQIDKNIFQFQNLTLLGCDLNDIPFLERQLDQCGFDWSKLTLVVSECALTYVPEQSVSGLFTFLFRKLQECELVIYEQILPNDSFGRIMCNHFQNRDTPLLNVTHFPTPADHVRRFYTLGLLGPIQCTPLVEFLADHFTRDEQLQRQESDPNFDEFEELILKCQHYVVVTANHNRNNSHRLPLCHDLVLSPSRPKAESRLGVIPITLIPLAKESRRFGHNLVLLSSGALISIGGHAGKRDGWVACVEPSTGAVVNEVFEEGIGIHSSSCALNHEEVLIFGGRSSPLSPSDKLFRVKVSLGEIKVNQVSLRGKCRPCARWRHAMVKREKSVILCGGRNSTDIFKDVFKWNEETSQWSFIGCLPFGLFSHSMALTEESEILVTGGLLPDQKSLNDQIIRVHLKGNRLKMTMWKHKALLGRFAHTSHVFGSNLILVGGIARIGEAGITMVNLDSDLVRNFELGVPRNQFLTVYNHGSCLNADKGVISVLGGGGNCFSFGMHIASSIIEIYLKQVIC